MSRPGDSFVNMVAIIRSAVAVKAGGGCHEA
jgi:hypothetical protein